MFVANEWNFAPADNRPTKLINDSKGSAYSLHAYSMIDSVNDANLIEIPQTASAISDIALAADYEFTSRIQKVPIAKVTKSRCSSVGRTKKFKLLIMGF